MRMPTTKLLLTTAFVAIVGPTSNAWAETTTGWYTAAGTELALPSNATADTSSGKHSVAYDPTFGMNLSAGYGWTNGFRLEGEVERQRRIVDSVSGVSSAHGAFTATNFYVNALYDLDLGTRVTPYVGLGLGATLAEADNIGPMAGLSIDDTQVLPAYQLIAGAALPLNYNWTITTDYRYSHAADSDYAMTSGRDAGFDTMAHTFTVGLRYSYDTPVAIHAVKAPSVPSQPAPKAVAAPVPQSYIVFFDFDKTELTHDALAVVSKIVADYHEGSYTTIRVAGHTDTKGSNAYNKTLSTHRAEAVKAELVRLGIPASTVSITASGKTKLLVPTADQVRDSHNRRVEIMLKK